MAALPLLAIPATAGTGSEMNRSAILTDPSGCRRDGLRSDRLFPRHALVDPEISMTQPPDLAARTAFDALSHAIESLVSPRARAVTDELAEAAVTLIADAIVDVAHGRATPAQHANLALAAALMGVNLSLVGTCLPHRIDKAVCALFPQITHGQCVAFFYPAWARRSWRGAVERFGRIARLLAPVSATGNDVRDASNCGVLLERLLDTIGLGNPPSAFGVSPADISRITDRVAGDLSANPVPVSPDDLQSFLEETIK
ncbi:MAG TPA: iron-containing alcohol dehydrogenase [Verrucomicrobiae bacterium]|nr:iron-containing alcohol dehydrogenase [Verrucomicrobiae bacterium]